MTKLVNLTPHEIRVFDEAGNIITIPPSGRVARVKTEQKVIGKVASIPIVKTTFGEVEGLPAPQPNTIFIVSSLVAQAVANERDDVVAPDTSPSGAVRDEKGNIVGVRRFQKW